MHVWEVQKPPLRMTGESQLLRAHVWSLQYGGPETQPPRQLTPVYRHECCSQKKSTLEATGDWHVGFSHLCAVQNGLPLIPLLLLQGSQRQVCSLLSRCQC